MFYKLAILAGSFSIFFSGCKTDFQDESSGTKSSFESCRDVNSVREFRDIFHHLASNKERYYTPEYFPNEFNKLKIDDDEIRQMMYLPTNRAICYGNELIDAMAATETSKTSGAEYLKQLEKQMGDDPSMNKIETFYQNGKTQPFQSLASTRDIFSSKGPVTIIVFPGFVTEFFDAVPFEDLQNAQSSIFRAQFQSAINNLKDSSWSNADYDDRIIPMSDVLKLSSLDAQGKALINMIYLPSPRGSLETVTGTGETSAIYLRRLNAFFAEIDREDKDLARSLTRNIYLLGYSRGHMTAVDLAVLARSQHAPWADRIKGIMNLAGVIYGTAIADDVMSDTSSATFKIVKDIEKLNSELIGLEELEVLTRGKTDIQKAEINWEMRHKNLRRQIVNAPGIILDAARAIKPGVKKLLKAEMEALYQNSDIKWTMISPGNVLAMLGKLHHDVFSAANFFDLNPVDHLKAIPAHFKAVSQWKRLFAKLRTCGENMTKAGRLDWFANHELPSDIKYYALNGSMPDRYDDKIGVLGNRYFGAVLPDFQAIRPSYYTMVDKVNLDVSDSQVSYPMSRFWPSLVSKLNPKQPPLDTYYLGMAGTHHLGIVWNAGLAELHGAVNLFPKTILLESMATFAVQHQDQ